MDLPQDTQAVLPGIHIRDPAGVVGGVGLAGYLKMDVLRPEIPEDSLHGPLQREEVHILAIGPHGEDLVFHRKAVIPAGEVDTANLV